jgi:hypothetical protein
MYPSNPRSRASDPTCVPFGRALIIRERKERNLFCLLRSENRLRRKTQHPPFSSCQFILPEGLDTLIHAKKCSARCAKRGSSPRAFLRIVTEQRGNIAEVEVRAPRLGTNGFGRLVVHYKRPLWSRSMPDETEDRKLFIVDERQLELFKEWVSVQKDEISLVHNS